ncbi:DUF4148 domain-containing protein [Paraburkholderia sp. BCC1885]|jgi:hypothetical protein|uniref:DUF4148 domain-containing protein n=1 Tax=Paraburkholderia sp. BCC1885 TaxID=2562669 RepID=UPI001183E88D|nr:DUF4148 domain-containing protein [Paraburkholderia sp. BCC1885]
MTFSPSRKVAVLLASAALVVGSVGSVGSAFAQSGGGGSASGDDANAGTAAPAPASSTKAQRKAARKQARAKKNAELKKLEDAGYHPSQNDPNYPQDLQSAEKKAGIGQGASQ